MESEKIVNKDLRVEIPILEGDNMSSGGTKFQLAPSAGGGGGGGGQGLTSQPRVVPKSNCLCSPTSHAGSFRCRLHRAPSLQRTKSIDSASLNSNDK